MKFQLFALLLVVAGACAMPKASDVVIVDSPISSQNQPAPRIIVENQIRRIIQQISAGLKDAGLDPLIIDNEEITIAPIPFVIELTALVENLRFVGVSNIRIHSLDYSVVLNRLRFDVSLPEVSLTVGNAIIEGNVLDNEVEGEFSGSVVIDSIRLNGEVRVNIGVISGISLRSVSLNFRLGGIRADVRLSLQGSDYSEFINNVLNVSIPQAIEDNRAEINELLENLVRQVFDMIS